MPTSNVPAGTCRAVENRVSEEELASFFSPDVVVEQSPNRLVPKVVRSTLSDISRESARGKKSVSRRTYTARNVVASDDWIALELDHPLSLLGNNGCNICRRCVGALARKFRLREH